MILWLDAQLSPALANWFSDHFTLIQAVPVRELGLRNDVLLRTLEQALASLRDREPWVEVRSSV